MTIFHLFLGFSGRIDRSQFWVASAVSVVLMFINSHFILMWVWRWDSRVAGAIWFSGFVLGVLAICAVGVKRFHDRNKTGWGVLVQFTPYIVSVPGAPVDSLAFLIVIASVGVAGYAWLFVELGCMRGTAGPNRFGPDPSAPA